MAAKNESPEKSPQNSSKSALGPRSLLDRIPGLRSCVDTAFRHRVVLALTLMTLLFSWAGLHFWDRYGLLVGFFSAMALVSLVFFYVERRLSNLFHSIELEGVDAHGILRIVRELSKAVGVRTPQVFILSLATPTALSAGLYERSSKLFLTEGLIARLSIDEIKLVITYELERLKNEQTQSLTALTAIATLVSTIANAFDAVLLFPFRRRRQELRVYGPMTFLTSPLVALLVRLAAPRESILEIDGKVGTATATAEAWAQTLWKLDAYNKTLPLDVNLAEACLFTVNPLNRFQNYPWCRMASAQPPIESRVRHLTGRYPL
jgi:heat shock protein HtpX